MSSTGGEGGADDDALGEGGRGPESAALTARHWLPLSGIWDYTRFPHENQSRAGRSLARQPGRQPRLDLFPVAVDLAVAGQRRRVGRRLRDQRLGVRAQLTV